MQSNTGSRPAVDILLATHNGTRYLPDQVESILRQTYTNWRLLVSDDASTDGTREIVDAYCQRFPGQIRLVNVSARRVGACQNFGVLLKHAQANYAMFCDQDDVWLEDKIEKSLRKIREVEHSVGPDRPVLVFTDLSVVDQNLTEMARSFWALRKIAPNEAKLNCLLTRNVAAGCTMIMNDPLRRLAVPIPENAIIHDWWVALVAAAQGHIDHIAEPLVLYRQHGMNDMGVRKLDLFAVLTRDVRELIARQVELKHRTIRQAAALWDRIREAGDDLETRSGSGLMTMIKDYVYERSWVKRRFILVKHGLLQGNMYVRLSRALFF